MFRLSAQATGSNTFHNMEKAADIDNTGDILPHGHGFLLVRQLQQALRHKALGSLLATDLDHTLDRGGCNIPLTRQAGREYNKLVQTSRSTFTRVSGLQKISISIQVLETPLESQKLSKGEGPPWAAWAVRR
jgi:hypothetical protein